MITRAKTSVFKTLHLAKLGVIRPLYFFSALITFTEPKGFKFVDNNPAWIVVMDKNIHALQNNHT